MGGLDIVGSCNPGLVILLQTPALPCPFLDWTEEATD